MSMTDYEKAKVIIGQNPAKAHFTGPRPEELVKAAEEALGMSFPPTYRRFVLEYGAGSFRAEEFFGVTDNNFEKSSVPNGIWYTLDERKRWRLAPNLVVIGDTGTGELYCLDLSEKDGPVVIVQSGGKRSVLEKVAPDFGAFFLQMIQVQISR